MVDRLKRPLADLSAGVLEISLPLTTSLVDDFRLVGLFDGVTSSFDFRLTKDICK